MICPIAVVVLPFQVPLLCLLHPVETSSVFVAFLLERILFFAPHLQQSTNI
jgi:hypothetical protein